MIKLLPVEEAGKLEELCRHYGVAYTSQIHAYISADESVNAQCVFSLDGYRVELLAASFDDDDPLIPELLIRAVGAYAANRSGYLFYIPDSVGQAMEETIKTMRFEKNETGYCGKVPNVLKGTCRCNDTN